MYSKKIADVQGSPMEILVFAPDAGLATDPWQFGVGERLAKAGYAGAMPFLFHWWPTEADIAVKRDGFRDDWAVADLAAAYRALAGRAGVAAERIGMVGHCWGGRVAWLGA